MQHSDTPTPRTGATDATASPPAPDAAPPEPLTTNTAPVDLVVVPANEAQIRTLATGGIPVQDAAGTGTADPSPSTEPRASVVPLFIGLMTTMLMAALSQTVLSAALPTIVGDLGGVDQMTWVVTSYLLASTITMTIYGRLSDQFGRKPLLLIAISLFMGGSVIGALASNIWWLVGARVMQGLGGGGLMILSQACIADVVPARERGKYVGFMGAVFAVSSVAGPLLGGWITEGPGWRWAFWMNLPLGVLALAAVIAFLHLPKRHVGAGAKIDYLGMSLLAAATTTLVLMCTWGGHTYDWCSPEIIGLGVATVAISAIFAYVETRAAHPVVPLHMFTDRNFTLTTIAAAMIGVAMFGALGYFPTYLQMVTGLGPTESGLLLVPMMAGMLVTAIATGRLVTKTGRYKIYPLLGAIVMTVGLWLLSTLHVDSPVWWMCTVLAIFGIGLGLSNQILTLIVQNSFPHAIVGTATAANNYFRQVGATVGSAVVGSLFVQRLQEFLAERMAGLGAGATGSGGASMRSLTPELVSTLPAPLHDAIIGAYNEALLPIFLMMVPLGIATFVLLCFVHEAPLKTTVEDVVPASLSDPVAD